MSLAYDTGSAHRSNVCPNSPWTVERTDALKEMWTNGLSAGQIACELGNTTRNAVIGKCHRIGLIGSANQLTPEEQCRRAETRAERKREADRRRSIKMKMLRAEGRRNNFASRTPDELPEVPTDDPSIGIPLMKLTDNQCHWPVLDSENPVLYCGQAVASTGSSYCLYHLMLKYRHPEKRQQ